MSRPNSGLYGRLVVLIGGVALLILLVALLVLRATGGGAAQDQVARNLRAQIALADLLLDAPPARPRDVEAALAELGIAHRLQAPDANAAHARFWDGVIDALATQLPDREVLFDGGGEPRIWVRRVREGDWIGVPVAPLRGEMRRSVLATLLAAGLITLVAAAAYARSLTEPLRQLAESAPEIVAGRGVAPLPKSAAREFHELGDALDAAADSVRETARDRSLMLAALSHDMRTPLARLRLACELAALDETSRDGMHQDIDELDRLIGQCIDYARDGRDEPIETVDVVALLHELAAGQERVGQAWVLEAPERAVIEGRPMALRRAIGNLMDNAQHHGQAPFELLCRYEPAALSIAVLDRGRGVDPTLLGKLGTPFRQAASSRLPGRSGLGLASALRVAVQHGGSIRFANREGGGFAATLALPSARSGS